MKTDLINKRRAWSAVAAVVAGALVLGTAPAGAATPQNGATSKTFQAPTTVPAADVISVTGPADGTRTVVLDAHETSVQAGEVLVAGPGARTPHGLLVKVLSVQPDGTGVTAITAPAPISDALAPGQYTKAIAVTPPGATTSPSARPDVSTGPMSWSIPISQGVQCNGTVTADIEGTLQVNPSADVELDVDAFGVHSASLSLSMSEDAALTASLSAAAHCTLKSTVIKDLPLLPFMIGPVYIEPDFTLTLDALLNANATASISGTQHFRGNVGVSYTQTGGLQATRSATNTFDFGKPQLSGAATLEAGVTASMALMIEGLAGPRVDARGYLGLTADSSAVPWWTLYGGITVTGGIQVLIFKLGNVPIWSQRWTLLQALGLAGATLQTAAPGSTYSQPLQAVGGIGPDTYAVTSESLPSGLTMSRSGVISGVPAAPPATQTSSFVVTATDATGATASASYSITVPGLGIVSMAALPAATTDTPYSIALLAVGAVGTPTWHLSGGTLPAGLALASSGVISGTPTATRGTTFTVTLSDSTGRTASKSFTLPVSTLSPPVCGQKGCFD
jgi:Putative Ig domain